ncbi:MAG: putative lipid II flippase FtsW [Candidatus Kerfeldbacteria bacterium]|nr:putative lipid II flippase FtsW [Candidatus Kerfeldbacteria bacterium]
MKRQRSHSSSRGNIKTHVRFMFKGIRGGDPVFLGTLITLILFGLIMLTSASSALGQYEHKDSFYYLKHQVFNGIILGTFAFIFMSTVNYRVWKKNAFALLIVSIVMLLLVFTPLGASALGASRWIDIGSFNFQPSEMVKLTFLLYLAAWFERKGRHIEDSTYSFLPFMALLGTLVLIIAGAQQDLGTMTVIASIAIGMYFVAGAQLKHMAAIAGIGAAAVATLVVIAPYRIARITTFLHPESTNTLGEGYHIIQALIAIGSGGLFGVGLGHSLQKYSYVPEVATDSIFAIISEELGFLFSFGLVALYIVLLWRMLRIARNAQDLFGKYVVLGITVWIGFQAFVNIGAMLSMWPLTGIPLPFISFGSTSLIMLLAACGLVHNISRRS